MIPKDRVLEKLDSLLKLKDFSGAKRLLQYWLSEAEYTGDSHGAVLIENEWMGLCRKLGEREDALRHAQNALDLVGKMGIGDTVGGATTYLNSATVCKAFDRPQDALNLYEMAREIYERQLSPADDRLAGLYNNMGLALVDLKRFSEANQLYEKALSILKPMEGNEPEMAITYLNLASSVEAELGLEQGAEDIKAYSLKAMDCMEVGKDRRDGGYAFVCEKCATVFGYYGEETYAKQLLERSRRIYEGA